MSSPGVSVPPFGGLKVVSTVGVQPSYRPVQAYELQHARRDEPEELRRFFAERQIEYSRVLQVHDHPDLAVLLEMISRAWETARGDWLHLEADGFQDPVQGRLCEQVAGLRRAGCHLEFGFEADRLPAVEIRPINDVVGYGLFALEEISRGAFVGEYAGVLSLSISLNPASDYLMPISVPAVMDYLRLYGRDWERLKELSDTLLSIDAAGVGNETRFINHAAPDWMLVAGGLSACNLNHLPVFHQSCWRVALFANRDIRKGEELRFDYGPTYFRAEHRRCQRKAYRIKGERIVEQALRRLGS